MSEPTNDDEFGRITSSAQMGALLRRLRGSRTQQNIADHARRHNFYVHRPDLSAIERGRCLPTANELRGILLGCGFLELFDSLDPIRQRLLAELGDPETFNGRYPPVSAPLAAPSNTALDVGTAHDVERAIRAREPHRVAHRRKLVLRILVAAAVVTTTTILVIVSSPTSGVPPVRLDVQAAIAAARESPLCAEKILPDPGVAPVVLAQDTGPADAVIPDRLVELRGYLDPKFGWIAWAHLAESASNRDRLWVDWSYLTRPTERKQWRQCGPHPIGWGPDSPAIRAVDSKGRERWFRACGQAPREDRPPGSKRSSFCTSWVPVSP